MRNAMAVDKPLLPQEMSLVDWCKNAYIYIYTGLVTGPTIVSKRTTRAEVEAYRKRGYSLSPSVNQSDIPWIGGYACLCNDGSSSLNAPSSSVVRAQRMANGSGRVQTVSGDSDVVDEGYDSLNMTQPLGILTESADSRMFSGEETVERKRRALVLLRICPGRLFLPALTGEIS